MNLELHPLDTLPNKDLVVRWRVSGTQARAAMLASGGAFALMLNPEAREQNAPVTPKEMVFLIDTSCSMNGAPLNAAKRAMSQALQQMNPDDTFMLIDFADRASSFHDAPLAATPNEVRRALAYLRALPAGGGTNQLSGIRRALSRPEDPRRVRMVLLMTDGFIGNEEEIFAETRAIRGNARVFGFGIGSSVNHYLLSRLSEEGRGFYQYLRPDEDAVEAVDRFTRRLARPLITNLSIDWGGLSVADTVPELVPDLFDAQPLIIQGRYRAPGSGTVVLRGSRAGQPVVFEVPVTLPALSTDGHALQMAWARRRIEQLSAVQYNVEQPEVVRQITELGLEYHLVTKYTSLVAVEDRPVTNVPAVTVTEPTLTADQTARVAGHGTFGLKGGEISGELNGLLQVSDNLQAGDGAALGSLGTKGGLGLDGVGAGGGGVVLRGKGGGAFPGPKVDSKPDGDDFEWAGGGRGTRGNSFQPPPVVVAPVNKPPTLADPSPVTGSSRPAPDDNDDRAESVGGSNTARLVLASRPAFNQCVERQRLVQPGLHGLLRMRWVINLDGSVTKVEVLSTEFENTEVARCITQVIRRFHYPRHRVQGDPVILPFKF